MYPGLHMLRYIDTVLLVLVITMSVFPSPSKSPEARSRAPSGDNGMVMKVKEIVPGVLVLRSTCMVARCAEVTTMSVFPSRSTSSAVIPKE